MSGTTQESAVALRNIIVGTTSNDSSDSLVGVNTTKLPDGALAFVVATKDAYRLDKTSVATTLGTSVIKPASGPGAWILVSSGGANPMNQQVSGTAALEAAAAFAVTANTWIGLQSGSSFYLSGPTSDLFTLNTTTGTLTYNGPSGIAFIAEATVTVSSAVAADVMELAIMTGTNSIIGTTTFQGAGGKGAVDTTTVSLPLQLSTSKLQTMSIGDTFFAAVRDITSSTNIKTLKYNLTLTPA